MVGRAFQRSLGHSFRAFQRRNIVISPLCGRITRHNLFITADSLFCGVSRRRSSATWREGVNCFWLIKALYFQQVVSKPGASYDAGRDPSASAPRQDVGSVLTPIRSRGESAFLKTHILS